MSLGKGCKTKKEHSGAKNRGGFWGYREDAKKVSKKIRRQNDRAEVSEQFIDLIELS